MISIVFRPRLKFVIKHCKRTRLFGALRWFGWRVQYQRRHLSHVHILFWAECDASDTQKIDPITNARHPHQSSIVNHRQMIIHYRRLIPEFQIQHHTRLCRNANRQCKYGYSQSATLEIQMKNVRFSSLVWRTIRISSQTISNRCPFFDVIIIERSVIRTNALDLC
jgi:hypothetical protein